MTNGNTNLINALASGISITEIFRTELERAVNLLLETELTEFLQYEKYAVEGYNSGNSRNGYYERTIKTQFGEIAVRIPRDRNSEFTNHTLPAYRREYGDLESMVIHLYKKGITTREIADLIEKMYGCHYSHQTVANMTKIIQADVDAFHARALSKNYVAIFCDATHIALHRGTVQKEALHIVLGIREDGIKEVLDYAINPTESKAIYKDLFLSLRDRGVEQVALCVSDGLPGLSDACKEVFPTVQHQRCWVHISRNVRLLVRKKDAAAVLDDLKKVYQVATEEIATVNLGYFLDTWSNKYPKLNDLLSDATHLFTYYKFPKEIRNTIYTTNLIEGLNKHFKRYTKRKEQFPNEYSLDRFAFAFFSEYNVNFSERIHKGFKSASEELSQLFLGN